MKIQIKNISQNPLPTYEVKGSAGMDIRADFSRIKSVSDITCFGNVAFEYEVDKDGNWNNSLVMAPQSRALIPTGIHIALPEGYEAQIRPRSGLALKHGITICNTPGTIDHGYLNEIGIILLNTSDKPFTIIDGDRIAQMVINKIETAEWEEVNELTGYDRGGGFGHTGKK